MDWTEFNCFGIAFSGGLFWTRWRTSSPLKSNKMLFYQPRIHKIFRADSTPPHFIYPCNIVLWIWRYKTFPFRGKKKCVETQYTWMLWD